jgi:hypothetical protein
MMNHKNKNIRTVVSKPWIEIENNASTATFNITITTTYKNSYAIAKTNQLTMNDS